MLPTYAPGDWLMVGRGLPLRLGDVAVMGDPRRPKRIIVKRLVTRHRDGWEVRGDNPDESTDSRSFGLVPGHLVTGRVLFRYGRDKAVR